jgi:multidrug efflux pump subunit AcrA (membrane-fusion protein)
MFARVTLAAGVAAPVVAVPQDAIVERAGVTYVAAINWVASQSHNMENGSHEKGQTGGGGTSPMSGQASATGGGGYVGILMPVTVGAEVGELIAITSGNVHPDMEVITHGNERMLPFPTPVEVVDEAGSRIDH